MAICYASGDRRTHSRHRIGHLGVDSTGCTEEEDVPHEEKTQADGWQGTQGRHGTQHLLKLWQTEKSSYSLPILCCK